MKRLLATGLLVSSAVFLGGCAETKDLTSGLIPRDAFMQPASISAKISAKTQADAMQAALATATKLLWKTKTVEAGYFLAERPTQTATGPNNAELFQLEVYLPQNGKGDVNIRVAPPREVLTGIPAQRIADEYLEALIAALPK